MQRFFCLVLLCVLCASASAQTLKIEPGPARQAGPRDEATMEALNRADVAPLWTVALPWKPDVLLVREGGAVFLARVMEGGNLETASAALGDEGPALTSTGDWTMARTTTPMAGASPALFADGNRLWLFDAERRTLLATDPTEQGFFPGQATLSERAMMVPFEAVDGLSSDGDLLLVLGTVDGESRVAAARVARTQTANPQWLMSLPLPDRRRHAAVLYSEAGGSVYVAGGESATGGSPRRGREVYRAELDPATGQFSTWALAAQRLPRSLGPVRQAQSNSLLALVGDAAVTLEGEALTSQTLAVSQVLESGAIAPWRDLPLAVPPHPGTLLAADEDRHQALVVQPGADGAFELHAFPLPGTARQANRAMRQHVEEQRAANPFRQRRDRTPGTLAEGLAKARETETSHLVLVWEAERSEQDRLLWLRQRAQRGMTQHLTLSTPATPEEEAQAVALAKRALGYDPAATDTPEVQAPFFLLLSPQGEPTAVHRGVPERQELFTLLRPTFTGNDAEAGATTE